MIQRIRARIREPAGRMQYGKRPIWRSNAIPEKRNRGFHDPRRIGINPRFHAIRTSHGPTIPESVRKTEHKSNRTIESKPNGSANRNPGTDDHRVRHPEINDEPNQPPESQDPERNRIQNRSCRIRSVNITSAHDDPRGINDVIQCKSNNRTTPQRSKTINQKRIERIVSFPIPRNRM